MVSQREKTVKLKYTVDWRALIPATIGGLVLGGILLFVGLYRPSAQNAPPPVIQIPLTLPLNQDGSLPTCSRLLWRDTVWTAVCFGNHGEEWVIERRPGDPTTYILDWPAHLTVVP